MRLRAATLHAIGGPFPDRVGNAHTAWTSRRGWLLALEADGALGLGEASPLPGYSADELPAVEAALSHALPRLTSVPDTCEEIEHLSADLVPPLAARFALETALLDLLARWRNTALHRLLRDTPPPPVARSGLLQSASLPDLCDEAARKVARGLSVLKLKVGALPVDRELARIDELLRWLPSGVRLRLDANGAHDLDTCASLLARLPPDRIELIEEPVAASLQPHLGATAVPWAADESLTVHAEALLDLPGCDTFVLKPAVLGLFGALRLGQRAVARGKRVLVTHLFDGPVALAAGCELALALAGPALRPCGLDPHPALAAYPACFRLPHLATPGHITPSPRPGLGLSEQAA